jgi:integrase/recombinase XerD
VELKTVQAMVKACDNSFLGKRDQAILLVLLDTGLRARELLSLDAENVNQVTGAVRLRVGKGRKPREVFISKETRKVTRAYLKGRQDDLPALFVLDDQTERLGYGGLRKVFQRRAKQANVKEPTAHDFRRAFAINMLRNGVDPITLARLMGHSSLKVLQRYLKQVTADLQDAHLKGSPVTRMGRE